MCSSTGGYPAPDFVWTKNGAEIPATSTEKIDGGNSMSNLTFTLTYEDNNTPLICAVKNVLEDTKTVTKTLNVQCKSIL